jgi:hypothetical protein
MNEMRLRLKQKREHCLEGFPVLHQPDVGVVAKGGPEALWMEIFRNGIAPSPHPTIITPLLSSHHYHNHTIKLITPLQ